MEGQQGELGSAKLRLLDDYLSRGELAGCLGVSSKTLEDWAARREGPAITYAGKRVLYRVEAVREWLLSCERGAVASKGAHR